MGNYLYCKREIATSYHSITQIPLSIKSFGIEADWGVNVTKFKGCVQDRNKGYLFHWYTFCDDYHK